MAPESGGARLYALVARNARRAVVLRRGPTRWTRLLDWDLASDALTPGQWIKSRVYERRCDLSPDGDLLSTFVARHTGPFGSWTAISRPPYFTALALWPKGDCWGGGGLFESERRFGLNHRFPAEPAPIAPHAGERAPAQPNASERDGFGRRRRGKLTKAERESRRAGKKARRAAKAPAPAPVGQAAAPDEAVLADGFHVPRRVEVVPLAEWAGGGEDDPIRYTRLTRDGWRLTLGGGLVRHQNGPVWIGYETPHVWRRPLANGRVLALRELGIKERGGRWNIENGAIEDGAGAVLRELGRVDFLDADHNGDALYGWGGKLWRLKAADPHFESSLVADLNAMTPEALPSPDWAREWP